MYMCWKYSGNVWLAVVTIITFHHTHCVYLASSRLDYGKTAYSENSIQQSLAFRDDWEIARYLKSCGRPLMLWQCRNAIQSFWDGKTFTFVDLYCDVIGVMQSVKWYYRNMEIFPENKADSSRRYIQLISPHRERDRYFSMWIDFHLRVYNVTSRDSGMYAFEATSMDGYKDYQVVYVDIVTGRKQRLTKSKHFKHRTYS